MKKYTLWQYLTLHIFSHGVSKHSGKPGVVQSTPIGQYIVQNDFTVLKYPYLDRSLDKKD
ncbi:MAG: hypothetical protein CVV30_12150 [Methanomicrobiales archaeon HGW-Methanomicrobiales-1]|nr:MAG: hypothetical protein CVV30_12150 [Methanomicrobiales archaeon HGW-Methanomicrobiales-1]